MKLNRRVMTAGATCLLAAGTGHVMQSATGFGQRLASVGASVAEMPQEVIPLAANIAGSPLPSLPDFSVLRAPSLPTPQSLGPRLAMLDAQQAATRTDAVEYDGFGLACSDVSLNLVAQSSAMIGVQLSAPCRANERVILRHAGLSFAETTSDAGLLDVSIPALTGTARVTAEFPGTPPIEASLAVSEIGDWQRTVLQWQNQDGLHLNAYEYGAAFGTAGHVHADQPRDPETAMGGYLTVLGNDALDRPMMAEVYSAPKGMTDFDLLVETEVTPRNCGRTVAATTKQVIDGIGFAADEVTLAMPDCDAAGDFVLLGLAPRAFAVAGR